MFDNLDSHSHAISKTGAWNTGEVLSSLQTTGQSNQILAQHAGSSGKVDAEVIDDAHVQITKRFFFKRCESVDQKDTDHKHAISNLESEWLLIHFNIL